MTRRGRGEGRRKRARGACGDVVSDETAHQASKFYLPAPAYTVPIPSTLPDVQRQAAPLRYRTVPSLSECSVHCSVHHETIPAGGAGARNYTTGTPVQDRTRLAKDQIASTSSKLARRWLNPLHSSAIVKSPQGPDEERVSASTSAVHVLLSTAADWKARSVGSWPVDAASWICLFLAGDSALLI